jgi:hypothetical protein
MIIAKLSPGQVVSIVYRKAFPWDDVQKDKPIIPPSEPVFKVATAMFALALDTGQWLDRMRVDI